MYEHTNPRNKVLIDENLLEKVLKHLDLDLNTQGSASQVNKSFNVLSKKLFSLKESLFKNLKKYNENRNIMRKDLYKDYVRKDITIRLNADSNNYELYEGSKKIDLKKFSMSTALGDKYFIQTQKPPLQLRYYAKKIVKNINELNLNKIYWEKRKKNIPKIKKHIEKEKRGKLTKKLERNKFY